MKLSFRPETLYFRRPFRIAHGVRSSTPVVFTRIEHEGLTGYGEACMPPYLGETHESCLSFLEKAADIVDHLSVPFQIDEVMAILDSLSDQDTAAKASVDIALHDLQGKLNHSSCWSAWELDSSRTPFTTYTLGIDTKEVIAEKILESGDYPVLKVKLDGTNDREIIEVIRSFSNKAIAVDVNQGWPDKEQALRMIEWLAGKNVLFVEQPLSRHDPEAARWLYERSPLPIFADESIQRLKDLNGIKGCFHGINIKLMKCTGMNEAYKMIRRAREMDLKILLGCMSESSCGVSAAAQLSPLADHADLDGPLLIKNDPFDGVVFRKGKIILSEKPGIGVIEKVKGKS
jgi:L-Ala-D/L-Glu epimerase